MEVQLRNPRAHFHPLIRPVSRRRGIGDGTCQVPKPGVPMYYPACPGYDTAAAAPASSSSGPAPAPGVYVAPTLTAAESCVDPLGNPKFTPDCVNRNLVTEAANQAKLDAANRSVFVQNCNRDWQMNAQQYQALGMPVPPNDCDYRTYGQTLPGTTGGSTGYLPSVPQEVIDWRSANPGGGVSVPWSDASAAKLNATPAPTPAPTSTTPAAAPRATTTAKPSGAAPSQASEIVPWLQETTLLPSGGMVNIPNWAVIAAAAVAAYFLFGGKK
jgi:hypothetical protein